MTRAMVVALVLTGCGGPGRAEVTADAPAASREREVASARARWSAARRAEDLPLELYPARALGAPDAVAVVSPPLPARLLRVHVAAGDQVKRGALLFSVVMPEASQAAAVLGPTGALVGALERRRGQLRGLAAEGLARASDLFAVEVDLARAQAERARAQAVVQGLGAEPGALRSPIDGVVVEVKGAVGEWRRPEDGPLARVVDPRARRVEVKLPGPFGAEARFALETAGAPVPLSLVGGAPRPDGDAPGYLAWFDAPEAVPPGAARVRRLSPPGALVVPSRAILRQDGGDFVVAKRGQERPARVRVEVLRTAEIEALVRGELEPGTMVSEEPHAVEMAP